ncbi:MAG TPA: hypothetical protein VH744_07795, partial [Terriglobales bacterium]
MYSQLIAAPDPTPFRKPRFIPWPSVCDTTRANWVNPSAEPHPAAPLPGAESFTIDVGCHIHTPSLAPGEQLPDYLQTIETICTTVTTPAQQSASATYTFSNFAAAPPLRPHLREKLYSTIDCGPGIPQTPENPAADHAAGPLTPRHSPPLRSKTGRPPLFDHVKRAQVCAMVRTGCSIRNAAQNAGVHMASISYARRTDPHFAAQLRAAEKHRDFGGVARINNAGEKSWRAAAWVLERASPKHFSLRGGKKTALPKHLGKRPLKKLIRSIALGVLVEWMENLQRAPLASRGLKAIE